MSLGELREAAVIATIVDRVSGAGRFCGETFLQKSAFFLKELFGVPLTPTYRLYHYGPFSFDLRDQLRSMEADDVVRIRPHEFGATYVVGDRYSMLQRQFPKTLAEYEQQIDFVVRELSPKGVKDLEALATALYVAKVHAGASADVRAKELHTIKPHVDMDRARASVAKVDEWFELAGAGA
ncbi:MAG TPA: hypothetical protein VF432_08210 [Thermoanaerobaculia bacterium]